MNDPYYHPLFESALELQNKYHDITRTAPHTVPEVRVMQNELHQLVQDIAVERSPQTIEHRIGTMQRQLHETRLSPKPFLAQEHVDTLHHHLETMRTSVHNFPKRR